MESNDTNDDLLGGTESYESIVERICKMYNIISLQLLSNMLYNYNGNSKIKI